MVKTVELPHLTSFLRAYGNVSAPWAVVINDDPEDIVKKRKELYEQQARLYSLNAVREFILQNSHLPEDEAKQLIRELLAVAKEIVGSDAPLQEIEGAAIYLIDVFRDCDELVCQKQTIKLRRMFGTYPPSIVKKALHIVKKITKNLIDDIAEDFIKCGFPRQKTDYLLAEEFGSKIKFNNAQPLDENNYLFPTDISCDTVEKKFEKLSFTFNDKKESLDSGVKSAEKEIIKEEKHDFNWLKSEISNSFTKSEKNFPRVVLADTVIGLLNSPRSNNELENELFDLLGFERYELIKKILKHRTSLTSLTVKTSFDKSSQKMPAPMQQVVIQSETEKQLSRQIRKDEKKVQKVQKQANCAKNEDYSSLDPKYMKSMREAQLQEARNTPLFSNSSRALPTRPRYPNVYDSYVDASMSAAFISGRKLNLPENHQRINNAMFEEISIPAVRRVSDNFGNELLPITALDETGQKVFSFIKNLNLIQSMVFDVAYNTNENMLVCAPTGAGKTNVALLTIVHEIKNNMDGNLVKKDKFKIVYVAPMKALASEMVRNFSLRLNTLGIQVKELTGDMQLTKTEIMQTQILVTTPEKWDVVTRKSTGDVALTQLVKLLILDEVHLLDGDRGPVLEALVARTLRQVETSQSMIRILGLSATLPNYIDVSRFLRVNPMVGLFFFDDRFRPVPLSPTFIGIKTASPTQQMKDMNEVCYMKVVKHVQEEHQVMVFVHARNATVNTAVELINLAKEKNQLHIFNSMQSTKEFGSAQKQMAKSRNKELREMFDYGFAIHHAGMLRIDRNYVEKFFREGLIKVLVCTSTLAWGVNLPARAVIIKGTEIYDSKHGSFVPLGVLDVMQIFGRAGRPQYDTEGHGTIITTHNRLTHYLSLLTRQHQIESNFENNLADNLNAEIGLGTVTNVEEGVEWLSYTYLYIRMMSNPHVYGLKPQMVQDDYQLLNHRKTLIMKAAKKLSEAKMIRYEERTSYLYVTDLGRTASYFYISYDSVMRFNQHLKQVFMHDDEILHLISQAREFDQLKVRDDETIELDQLLFHCWLPVKGGCTNTEGKVNILLQIYLSRMQIQSFSLVSDQAYIVQNATRIIRFLFEVALRKGWAVRAACFLKVCKMIERQQWQFKTPLRQFSDISREALDKIDKFQLDVDHLIDMDVDEIAVRTRCQREKKLIKLCLQQIPRVEVEPTVQPITNRILRLTLHITPNFIWKDKTHGGGSEPFWIWIEDPDSDLIYHFEYFLLQKRQVLAGDAQTLVFTIPLAHDVRPSQYLVRVISDRWLGSDQTFPIDFQKLILPHHHQPQTELLDLQPLPVEALQNEQYEALYKFKYFNPIQTQIFHALYYTDNNVLLGAPTGSGKTIAAEIAMFRVFNRYPKMKIVYIAPLKALVRERIEDWKVRFAKKLKKNVVELTGDVTPDAKAIAMADIIVTTPEKWDGVSRSWQTRNYVQSISLLVIDEIHLLGESRGPVLEVIVSRTNFISAHTEKKVRIIGLSTALSNAQDLANWLSIKQVGLYNFKPSVRPVPLDVHVSGYPGKHYCPRMALMNKPTYQAIRSHSPDKPSLVFVSSRRQTRLTALDLIAYLVAESNPHQWVHMPEEDIQKCISIIRDQNLKLTLAFGIGLHHAGLHEHDRKLVEQLFLNQKIQVLIATATLAWGVNLPAHLVVVKGTEYFDGKVQRYVDFPITDVLQMIGRAGRPQYDSQGVAVVLVQDVKKNFYKKFLYDPFPVESSLIDVLPDHLNAEIVSGTINAKQQCLDYLTWTYFFRRLLKNPGYYGLECTEPNVINRYLSGLVNRCLEILQAANCIDINEDDREIQPTVLGRIASYYYLCHKTLYMFRSHLSGNVDMDKILWILCEASEYDELPVRHNEDSLNEDLSKECPVDVNPHTFDNPHTKANLLLQAHFSRLKLPCTDYYTDLKSVLDQAIRIIQALIDVASDRGWLATTISCMMLLQMVLQARWYSDNTLLTLPHIERQHLHYFRVQELSTADSRKSKMKWTAVNSLPELIIAVSGRYELLTALLREEFAESEVNDIFETLTALPVLDVNCSMKGHWDGWKSQQTLPVRIEHFSGERPASHWLKVHADQQYVLNVNITRISRQKHDKKALAPNFPKQKDEGWFLVLGNVDTKELIAMKRVPYVSKKMIQQMIFCTPEKEERVIYTLFLISDSYMGLDQQYDVCLDVVEKYESHELSDSDSDSESDESIYESEEELDVQ